MSQHMTGRIAERRVAGWSERRDCARMAWSGLAALLNLVILLGVGHEYGRPTS